MQTSRYDPGTYLRRSDNGELIAAANGGSNYVDGNAAPFGGFADLETGSLYDGYSSSITGISKEYGQGYKLNVALGDAPGSVGQTATQAKDGVVIVRAPKDAANNPKPDAPVAWGQFTTNGDEHARGTYGPDAQGRTWEWAEWNVAGDYSVNLTGGQYWVLCVGGGDGGHSAVTWGEQGQPGLVNEGYWEFQGGPTQITVGEKGFNNNATQGGLPSSIGSYGTQGEVVWGQAACGRGGAYDDPTGYKSFITGEELEYAPGFPADARPGQSGNAGGKQTDGCVIIAAVTNEQSDWNPPGSLPGLGTWAQVTSVTGMPNRYTYNDGIDWVAFEWIADGELTTSGGLVEALLVGSGSGAASSGVYSGAGRTTSGVEQIPSGQIIVKINDVAPTNQTLPGTGLFLNAVDSANAIIGASAGVRGGNVAGQGSTDWIDDTSLSWSRTTGAPTTSSIRTGIPETYARGSGASGSSYTQGRSSTGYGDGSTSINQPGHKGAAIIRVPADLAAGVDPTTYNDVTVRSVVKEKAKEAVKSEIKSRRKKK